MTIYIIIVTYNAAPWLIKCLNSIISAHHKLHIIVVDNNSVDDTITIIENRYKEVTLIKNEQNLGFGKANNKGIKYAIDNNADYIFLLNQDAWVKADTIDTLVYASIRHPNYFILSPLHFEGTEARLDLNFSKYAGPDYCEDFFSDIVINRNSLQEVYETKFVNAAFWLLPKVCLTKIGGFDPLFPHYGEDDDFIHRVHYHGHKVGICPSVTAVHDRSQEPFDLKKLNKKSRYNRMKVGVLISLKNINKNFFKELLKAYVSILKNILTSTLKLNGTKLFLHLRLLAFITVNLRKIKANRESSKQVGMSAKWFEEKFW